jgi:hypothetical protein
MDEKQLRVQCLQMAQQALQYNGTAGSVRPTPETLLTAAKDFYTWISELPTPTA